MTFNFCSGFCVIKRHPPRCKYPQWTAQARICALHLPFYDAKAAAKVECQQTLGRLKKGFQTAFHYNKQQTKDTPHARLPLQNLHPRPQYGGRTRIV
ncbi:hypothetical protein, partial [Neisseria bacilliformis]|uniref:hypothetical protein n=1 Tax=Neisseria bacilliformis TaxID=267212 RepID=UPI0028EF5155